MFGCLYCECSDVYIDWWLLQVHLFVLETICNPGLRERHWELMGQELGFEVKHGEDMTLSSMIGDDII